MRTILISIAAASALALAASSAYAGSGCFFDHQQVVETTAPEVTVAMSTFEGASPLVSEEAVAVSQTVCPDGDADCQTPPAE